MGHIAQREGNPDEICKACQRQKQIIENGGRGLTSEERVAVVEFFGRVVSDDGVGEIEDSVGGMVWGDGVFADFGDHSNRLAVF